MKTLALAFGIVLTAILVLFFAFRAFGVADKVAGPLASSLLGLITWVHGVVDKALNGSESKFSKRIIPVNEFGISWPLMLVYAGLIVVAIVEAADIVAWVLLKLILQISVVSASRPIQDLALVSVLALPGVFWGIFLLGRWIGVMTGAKGYWILPVSVLTGRFLEALAISIRTPQLFLELLDSFRSVSGVAASVGMLIIATGVGLLGVWRGNRIRIGAYFNYLFKQLPDATRNAILDMTFEEAKGQIA
jgi:hypothetical protein